MEINGGQAAQEGPEEHEEVERCDEEVTEEREREHRAEIVDILAHYKHWCIED